MEKKKEKLLNKFALIFFNFTVVTLVISGLMTYVSQMDTYKTLCRDNCRALGAYLNQLMSAEGDTAIAYKEFYMDHYREMEIPYDFSECRSAQADFVTLFSQRYPGQTFGIDIQLKDLDEDVQKAYFKYKQEYWVLTFEKARDAFGLSYVYFMVMGDPRARIEDLKPDDDPQYNVLYMIDGERTEVREKDAGGNEIATGKLWLGDTYGNNRKDHLTEWKTWETGECLDEFHEWNNAWGHQYTYYTPLIINGTKLGLICTDIEVESINNTILKNALVQIAGIAAILIACMLMMLWFINRFYISKIRFIETNMREYTETKDKAVADRIESTPLSNDEIGNLADQTVIMMREVDRYISEMTSLTTEKERFSTELGIATKIQMDMMPKDFPKRNDLDMYAVMSPAKEVGGDFYDYFFIDSNHLGLVMADVSGKGVPAALFMVIAKTLISNRAIMGGSPARVLEDINFRLCENNASGMFITAWLGILTLSTGQLICANAGHEYPAIRRKNGKYELFISDHCPPLAAMEDIEYEDEIINLEPGDSLFLYTDGVPEAKNHLGKHLGTTKMLEILNAAPDLAPYDLLNGLKELIDDFARGTDTFDDITMMCINYLGKK